MNIRLITLIICISIVSRSASAQLLKRMHAKKNEPAPKAILIQLFTYQNRAAHFKKHNRQDMLNTLQRDIDSVITKMTGDFNDHFSYCPKYYYIDTNAQKVLNKDFEGVLLNEQLEPVDSPIIGKNDTDYFIVLFGNTAKSPADDNEQQKAMGATGYTVVSSKHRLVVCDHKLNKNKKPLPDGTNNRWPGTVGRTLEPYRYKSTKFDISYTPYAAHFNAKLFDFYGPYPYNK